MINNFTSILSTPDRTLFGNSIRTFFSWLVSAIYSLIADAVDMMYKLATHDYGLSDYVNYIGEKIFNILIIFMLFKLTISIMTYLIDPDSFYDKNKGFSGIIKRVIISVALLISINPIFTILNDIQSKLISEDVIVSLFNADDNDEVLYYGDGTVPAYGIHFSPYCNSNLKLYTFSKGDRLSVLLFQPFFQPYSPARIDNTTAFEHVMNNEESYCGIDITNGNYDSIKYVDGYVDNNRQSMQDLIPGPNSVDGLMQAKYYNLSTGEAERNEWVIGDDVDGHGNNGEYFMNFNFLVALLAGAICLLILISFCFDVVVRSFTIILLQIIAPIPIISYVSPQGKSSEMLSRWGKKLFSTWISLFVRIAALSIAISFISVACSKMIDSLSGGGLIFQTFIIIGILIFAKQLPKLLEELFPGLKLGKMELNPFKRVTNEALGGKQLLSAGATLGAAGLSGTTNFIHRVGAGLQKGGLRGGVRALPRAFGSAIAGATSGGYRAFRSTSKDGKMFFGLWNGYTTSMFSKKLRDDELRKAGLQDAGTLERVKFGAGSVMADVTRFAGILNKGQREDLLAAEEDASIKLRQDELDAKKYELAMNKARELEPYQLYSGYASKIKSRIDNSKPVKDAERALENARATGKIKEIEAAQIKLDDAKKKVANTLFTTDNDVRDLVSRMNTIRSNNQELQKAAYDMFVKNDSGQMEFKATSIYNTEHYSNIISRKYEDTEREYKVIQENINEDKRKFSNDEAHNPMSHGALNNASRFNNGPEKPGFKATPNQSSQAQITDNSQFSNLGGNGQLGGHGAPPSGGRHGRH